MKLPEIEQISKEKFTSEIKIFFSNINDGFNKFHNIILEPTKDKSLYKEAIYSNFFKELFFKFHNNFYVDFYYYNLDEESKSKIKSFLTQEEINLLNLYEKYIFTDSVFFKVNNLQFINLITKLSTNSILFSTFYINNPHITIWSNYDYKFPMFYIDTNTYVEIAPLLLKHELIKAPH